MLYQRPTAPDGAKILNLVPDSLGGEELTPETRVLCINRGATPYRDKYDGRDYTCPPGLFEVEYKAADHFRGRSVIPGTRDPITGKQEHYIAILGIDRADRCEPLTKAEDDKAAAAPEAIDRTAMDGPAKHVQVISTMAARARTAGGNRRIKQSTESNDGTEEAPDAMKPVEGGDAMKQIARDAAAKAAEADE